MNKKDAHKRKGNFLIFFLVALFVFFLMPAKNSQAIFDSINTSSYLTLGATGTSLNQPWDVATCNGKMFVADYSNNRVLIYNSIPTSAGATADYVIGQASLSGTQANQGLSAPTASTLFTPGGVYCDGTKVYISDTGNNRVLIYNSIPYANNASANVVVGQGDFVSGDANRGYGPSAADSNRLNGPSGIFASGSKLFISDMGNNRVLIFNSIPSALNAAADVVVGQHNMTSCDDNQGGSAAADTLNYPRGVYTNGTNLIIADNLNNRVLIYSAMPSNAGASANYVVGQSSWSGVSSNQGGSAAANTVSYPTDVHMRGSKFIISDTSNNRLTVFDTIPASSNASANTIVTGMGLSTQMGMATRNNKLLVANYSASRILVVDLNITYPSIDGVSNGATYDHDVTPTFSAVSAYLDGGSIMSGETISSEGEHTLTVNDSEGDATTIVFTIQKAVSESPEQLVATADPSVLAYGPKKKSKRSINFVFHDFNLSKKAKKSWVKVYISGKRCKINRVKNRGEDLIVRATWKYGKNPTGAYDLRMTYRNKFGKIWQKGIKSQSSILYIQ